MKSLGWRFIETLSKYHGSYLHVREIRAVFSYLILIEGDSFISQNIIRTSNQKLTSILKTLSNQFLSKVHTNSLYD